MTVKPFITGHHHAAVCMELMFGPSVNMGSLFEDREELAEAWATYGPEVMALYAKGGKRPMGWWQFEAAARGLIFDDEREKSILWAAGVLDANEKAEVETAWRPAFDRAQLLH